MSAARWVLVLLPLLLPRAGSTAGAFSLCTPSWRTADAAVSTAWRQRVEPCASSSPRRPPSVRSAQSVRVRTLGLRAGGAADADADTDTDADTDAVLRRFVAGALRVERVDARSSAQCRAVAAVRCGAFSAGLSVDETIARRFDLMGVLRARVEKGAVALAASIHGPFPPAVLDRLEGHAELQTDADRRALAERRRLLQALEAGGGDEGSAAAELAEALARWQEGTQGRSIVVGAVDLSNHEFDLSSAWRAAYASNCSYLSDMAVERAFRRLGIGARLLTDAVRLAREEGRGDVFLHVEEDNAPAVSMYEREGFRRESDSVATRDLFDALHLYEEARHNILLRLRA